VVGTNCRLSPTRLSGRHVFGQSTFHTHWHYHRSPGLLRTIVWLNHPAQESCHKPIITHPPSTGRTPKTVSYFARNVFVLNSDLPTQIMAAWIFCLYIIQHLWLTRPDCIAPSRHPRSSRRCLITLECLLCPLPSWRRFFSVDDIRHHPHRWWCGSHCRLWNRTRADTLVGRST